MFIFHTSHTCTSPFLAGACSTTPSLPISAAHTHPSAKKYMHICNEGCVCLCDCVNANAFGLLWVSALTSAGLNERRGQMTRIEWRALPSSGTLRVYVCVCVHVCVCADQCVCICTRIGIRRHLGASSMRLHHSPHCPWPICTGTTR